MEIALGGNPHCTPLGCQNCGVSLGCLVVLHQGATKLPLGYLATLDAITLTFWGELSSSMIEAIKQIRNTLRG